MYLNEKSLIDLTQKERHAVIDKIVKQENQKIVIPKNRLIYNAEEIHKFYKQSLEAGSEGIMIKSLSQKYVSGRKVGGWIKLKPILETLDLVITKAEWGTGKRANWLSSFTVACLSSDGSTFLEIGKVGTGIKEKTEEEAGVTFEELTELLKPLMLDNNSKEIRVKAKIVVEVNYEEIQESREYSSGFALRFPRIIRLRNVEKSAKDINNIEDIKRIYALQRGRKTQNIV
jgi:DNA ligase 1